MSQVRVYVEIGKREKVKEELEKLGFRWCKKDGRFEKNGKLGQEFLDQVKKMGLEVDVKE